MRRRGVGLLVLGSIGVAGCRRGGDDQGPSEPPLDGREAGHRRAAIIRPVRWARALGNPLRILITRDGEPVEGVGGELVGGAGRRRSATRRRATSSASPQRSGHWARGRELRLDHRGRWTGATNSPFTYSAHRRSTACPDRRRAYTVTCRPTTPSSPASVTIAPRRIGHLGSGQKAAGGTTSCPTTEEPPSSGVLREGPFTYTHVFDTPGTYRYYCAAHGSPRRCRHVRHRGGAARNSGD